MTQVKSISLLRASFFLAVCLLFPVGAQAADAPAPAAQPQVQAQKSGQTAAHNSEAYWRQVRSGTPGVTTVRGTETGVLVSPDGNTWRQIRNGPVTFYGSLLVIVVIVAIALFHSRKGMLRLSEKPTGKSLVRFSNWERSVHWVVAISFVCLALTGGNMLLGKYVLMPVIGHTLFSWLAGFGKFIHNFLGVVFSVGAVLMLVTFYKDNIWHPSDAEWIRKAGGLVSREHVPSRRFNFGEKIWFWLGVGLFGLIMMASGLSLLFPNLFETRYAMQTAEVIHSIAATLIFCMSLGHIYLGTIGVEGAYQSIRTGSVDETWAKEHHQLWYDEQVRNKVGKGA
ncbi:MAG: formate dehydrogenase subunit gamma [Sterolibacterium sp.]|jgi:formate dehydrogenase subunit gamma